MHKNSLSIAFLFLSVTFSLFLGGPSSAHGQSPFASVKMEVTLAREAAGDWRSLAALNIQGNEISPPVQKLKIGGNSISFAVVIEGAEVVFTGRFDGNKLGGALEASEKGARIATGTWNLTRAEEGGAGAADLTGKWAGTFSAQPIPAQQADPNFKALVSKPAYLKKHPKVLFDEAHNNIHTSAGLYKPFVDLITSDGYAVTPNKEKFRPDTLAGYDVLVIANAAGPRGQRANPAFTDEECDAVGDWVRSGGSLLFIADHAPMGAAAEILAKRFGVDMSKAYTDDPSSRDKELGDILFSRENKLLADLSITRGRNPGERVGRVVTFTGQSLKGPAGSTAFLKLPDTALDTFPQSKTSVSAAGRAQGVLMKLGKGRVIVLGEAGMLSAQIDNKGKVFGMNYPNTDNRQLALNIMHWLSGLLN